MDNDEIRNHQFEVERNLNDLRGFAKHADQDRNENYSELSGKIDIIIDYFRDVKRYALLIVILLGLILWRIW